VAIDPTGAGLKSFLDAGPDEPVVMLNLLRFVDGGQETYEQYLTEFGRYAGEVGAEVVYYGYGDTPLVAEHGQDWDAVLLVRYPSRRAFSEMVADPRYRPGTALRSQPLVEAVLQPTRPAPTGRPGQGG